MAKVTVDGITFDIPDTGITGDELKQQANLPADSTVYRVRDGQHEIIEEGENVDVQEADRFGSITRFRAAE